MESIIEAWRWLKETLWSRVPDPAKRILRIIAPEPDLFVFGLLILVIGQFVSLPIRKPAALDDMVCSHVCITDVYKVSTVRGGAHWELKTTLNRYYIFGSDRECQALKTRMDAAASVIWPDNGDVSAAMVPRGLIADIWCFQGRSIYELRIDGEPVVTYTPPKSEDLTDDSRTAHELSLIAGLSFILLPVIRKKLKG